MSIQRALAFSLLAVGFTTGCPTPQQDQVAADYRSQFKRQTNGAWGNGAWGNGVWGNGQWGNGQWGNGQWGNGQWGNGTWNNDILPNGVWNNGVWSNGSWTNGVWSNGAWNNGQFTTNPVIPGLSIKSISYTDSSGQSQPVTGLNLSGGELIVSIGNNSVRGVNVKGLELHYSYTPTPSSPEILFSIRFDGAGLDPTVPVPTGQTNDVWMYNIVGRIETTGAPNAWYPVCSTETGAPDQAVLLANYWDVTTGNRVDQPSITTIACRDFALGKCARMGYRPWAKAQSCTGSGSQRKCADVGLTDHHQACTRMMRADYCGTGKSYTVNGTVIDVYDYLNPPVQVPETDWDIEARWTPTGAICINEPRHPELVGKWKRPDCNGDGKPDSFPACGQSDNRYSGKGLVVDRFDDDQSSTKK